MACWACSSPSAPVRLRADVARHRRRPRAPQRSQGQNGAGRPRQGQGRSRRSPRRLRSRRRPPTVASASPPASPSACRSFSASPRSRWPSIFRRQTTSAPPSAGVAAAKLALHEARTDAAEDAVNTYIALDNALQRKAALAEGRTYATRLVADRRRTASTPASTPPSKSPAPAAPPRRCVCSNSSSTTKSPPWPSTSPASPASPDAGTRNRPRLHPRSSRPIRPTPPPSADPDGIRAAFANATPRTTRPRRRPLPLRPQVAFSAGYSRISTIGTNYVALLPRFRPNAPRHQPQLLRHRHPGLRPAPRPRPPGQGPWLGRRSRPRPVRRRRSSATPSSKAALKLQHAAAESPPAPSSPRLTATSRRTSSKPSRFSCKSATSRPNGQSQIDPKDEQNARLQERQKFIECLDADLQLRQTQINAHAPERPARRLAAHRHRPHRPNPALPAAPSATVVPTTQPLASICTVSCAGGLTGW